jgi:hypothetical protein
LTQHVRTEDASIDLWIWIDAPGPVLSDPPAPVFDAISTLVLYPVEILVDLSVAIHAPFDPALDVRWGPLGGVVGIVLPWVTLVPDFYGPLPLPDVNLEPDAFDLLVSRVRQGDGANAYREIVGQFPWRGGEAALLSVELKGGSLSTAAQLDAAADESRDHATARSSPSPAARR